MKSTFNYDTGYFPAFPVVELTISSAASGQQRTLTGLVDSGSDATQLPLSLLRAIGAEPADRRWIRDLSGIRVPVATFVVQMQVGPLSLSAVEVVGREGSTEVIVGRDVLNQLIVTLNGLAHVLEISD